MTAIEQAEQLIHKFFNLDLEKDHDAYVTEKISHECAIIFCEGIINEYKNQIQRRGINNHAISNNLQYWDDVLAEVYKSYHKLNA